MRALSLAAGINEGGHYFRYFGPSGVRALPLAAGINEGGHYLRYFLSSFLFFLPSSAQAPALAGLGLALISISPHPTTRESSVTCNLASMGIPGLISWPGSKLA